MKRPALKGQPRHNHLPFLDLFRAVAAFLVVLEHARNYLWKDYGELSAPSLLTKVAYFVSQLGHEAVMVFFVLSGMVVGRSAIDSCKQGTWSWQKYFSARLTRLWVVLIPAIIATLVLDFLSIGIAPDGSFVGHGGFAHIQNAPLEPALSSGILLGNVFFLQTIVVPTFGSNGPLWSLAYEFWYYVGFPLLWVALFGRQSWRQRIAYAAVAVCLLAGVGGKIAVHFPIWLLGVAAYLASPRIGKFPRSVLIIVTCAAGVSTAALVCASRMGLFGLLQIDYLGKFTMAACFAGFISVAIHLPEPAWLSKGSKFFADFSYSLYLVHLPLLTVLVVPFIRNNEGRCTPSGMAWLALMGGLVASYAFALLFYAVFERRTGQFRAWLRRFKREPTLGGLRLLARRPTEIDYEAFTLARGRTPLVLHTRPPTTRMKVLVWSINYAPEATGIAPCNVALCEYLFNQGHTVEIVTTFPYYPMWTKRPEDQGRLYRTDMMNGVPVHRCWHYVPAKVKAWKRIVHEASFVVTSFLRVLSRPRPDVMVVVSPPLLLGAAAWVAGALRGVPFLFHVQDLQPDAALGLGMLKPGPVAKVLYGLEAVAYRAAERVSGITKGMLVAFTRKGVSTEKQCYLPNGATLPELATLPSPGRFRQRLGLSLDALLAVYSGNLGVKQGLPILIEAAALCKDPRVQVVICGDGAEREALAARVTERGLKNVHLLPLQDRERYEEMLGDGELCLITQQAGTGQFFFPSKLLTTLAFAKPVLAVADDDSELAVAVREGEFGFCVPTGDSQGVARALETATASREGLSTMGNQGREYVAQFEAEKVLAKFEAVLLEIAGSASAASSFGATRP